MNVRCRSIVLFGAVLLGVGIGISVPGVAHGESSEKVRDVIFTRIAKNWERNDVIVIRTEVPVRTAQAGVDPRYCAARTDEREVVTLPNISFSVQPNGQVFDCNIIRSSGISAIDLSCLDAVLGCSPFEGVELKSPITVQCDFGVLNAEGKSQAENYSCHNLSKSFAISFPSNEPVFYFHSIPADAARRFPDAIRKNEVHTSENSRCLRIGSAELQLKTIRNAWEQFFANHPQATKQELLKQREHLDQEFRTWFDDAERQPAAAGWGG